MPTYEYECDECGAVTEVFQSIKDAPLKRLKATHKPACKCRATVTRRIGTGGGLIFRGSGFYQTDYRSESYRQAAKAESEGSNGKSSKSSESGGSDGKAPKSKSPAKDAT